MKKVIVILLFTVCSLLLITQPACSCNDDTAEFRSPFIFFVVNEKNPVYIYAGDKLDYKVINLKIHLNNGTNRYHGGGDSYTYDTYDEQLGYITPVEGTVLTEGTLVIEVYWKGPNLTETVEIPVRPASEKGSKDTSSQPSSETTSQQPSQISSEKTSSAASSTKSEASSIVSSAPASSAISSTAGSSASTSSIPSLPSSSPSSAPESSEESSVPESEPEETTYTRAIQMTEPVASYSGVIFKIDSLKADETLYVIVCDAKFSFSSPQAVYEAYKSGENLKAKTSFSGPKEEYHLTVSGPAGDLKAFEGKNTCYAVVVRDDGAINTSYWKYDFEL